MRGQNAEGLRSRGVCRVHAIGLMLGGIVLVTASGHAGVLTTSWTAPTTNTDGSALTDLTHYRVYYDTSDTPCPGSTFVEVAAPESNPPPNETVSFQLTGLTTGSTYSVSVTAVDARGKESACSGVASAIARDDSATTVTQNGTAVAPVTQGGSATTSVTQDGTSTTPVTQDGSATAPVTQAGSAATPKRFCPPGQAKKGSC